MYPNPTPIETKLGAWRQNAGNFVGKSRKLTINKALLSIPKDTEMDVFRTGDWVNFKDSSGKAIFRDANNNIIFITHISHPAFPIFHAVCLSPKSKHMHLFYYPFLVGKSQSPKT